MYDYETQLDYELTVPQRRITACGLDAETLEKMEAFYDGVYLEEVRKCLESVIQYHADPSYRNWLSAHARLSAAREHMIRRDVFNTHNK